MAGYAVPHSTHRNTIAGGLCKRSFDDWQRTAFKSVVGAPTHPFQKVFKDSPPSPKRARICSRVTEGAKNRIEKVQQGTLRSCFSARIWGSGLRGSTNLRSTNYYRSSALQYAARNRLFFGKAFRRSERRTMRLAQIQRYVRAMIYAGQGSVKRRKASVAGIGMVL